MELIDKETLESHIKHLEGMVVNRATLGYGSFITLDFGKDISVNVSTNEGESSYIRGEWSLLIQMAFWEFEKDEEVVVECDDEREQIEAFLKTLEGKKLKKFQVTTKEFDAVIEFEDEIDLYLIANNEEEDNEQWMLTIPGDLVCVAGPGTQSSIEPESGD